MPKEPLCKTALHQFSGMRSQFKHLACMSHPMLLILAIDLLSHEALTLHRG